MGKNEETGGLRLRIFQALSTMQSGKAEHATLMVWLKMTAAVRQRVRR